MRDDAREIEAEIAGVESEAIRDLSVEDFYDFLYYKYFLWKYTQKNRLATTRKSLRRYKEENRWSELEDIQKRLFFPQKVFGDSEFQNPPNYSTSFTKIILSYLPTSTNVLLYHYLSP